MSGLGSAADVRDLVPGDPAAVTALAADLDSYASVLGQAGEGLRRIDTAEGWSGDAGDAFRAAFHGEPGRWSDAGAGFATASRALDRYAVVLQWAQDRAAEAIREWAAGVDATASAPPSVPADPGEPIRAGAEAVLDRALRARDAAAEDAARAVAAACRDAPAEPGFLERASERVGTAVAGIAADVGNAAASLTNAAVHHPGTVAGVAGGALLVGVSAVGEVGGAALDGTVVAAPAGLGLNAVSTAGILTGAGIAGTAATSLAIDAVGPDRVQVFSSQAQAADGDAAPDPPFPAPKEITGRTRHGQERIDGSRGDGGVNDEALEDAVRDPVEPLEFRPDKYGGTYRYVGKDAVVNLNSKGQVTSAWPEGDAGRRIPR